MKNKKMNYKDFLAKIKASKLNIAGAIILTFLLAILIYFVFFAITTTKKIKSLENKNSETSLVIKVFENKITALEQKVIEAETKTIYAEKERDGAKAETVKATKAKTDAEAKTKEAEKEIQHLKSNFYGLEYEEEIVYIGNIGVQATFLKEFIQKLYANKENAVKKIKELKLWNTTLSNLVDSVIKQKDQQEKEARDKKIKLLKRISKLEAKNGMKKNTNEKKDKVIAIKSRKNCKYLSILWGRKKAQAKEGNNLVFDDETETALGKLSEEGICSGENK